MSAHQLRVEVPVADDAFSMEALSATLACLSNSDEMDEGSSCEARARKGADQDDAESSDDENIVLPPTLVADHDEDAIASTLMALRTIQGIATPVDAAVEPAKQPEPVKEVVLQAEQGQEQPQMVHQQVQPLTLTPPEYHMQMQLQMQQQQQQQQQQAPQQQQQQAQFQQQQQQQQQMLQQQKSLQELQQALQQAALTQQLLQMGQQGMPMDNQQMMQRQQQQQQPVMMQPGMDGMMNYQQMLLQQQLQLSMMQQQQQAQQQQQQQQQVQQQAAAAMMRAPLRTSSASSFGLSMSSNPSTTTSLPSPQASSGKKGDLSPVDQERLERTIHLMGIDSAQPLKALMRLVTAGGSRPVKMYRLCGDVNERRTTRYSFIEMEDRQHALECVQKLHLLPFGANFLQCSMARAPIYQGTSVSGQSLNSNSKIKNVAFNNGVEANDETVEMANGTRLCVLTHVPQVNSPMSSCPSTAESTPASTPSHSMRGSGPVQWKTFNTAAVPMSMTPSM